MCFGACLACNVQMMYVTAVANLLMRRAERDLIHPQQLAVDLPLEGLLIAFNAQQEIGPLLRELSKDAL
jgi:hypothetical protein